LSNTPARKTTINNKRENMNTFKEFSAEVEALEYMNSSLYESEPPEEGFIAASVISSKLSNWKTKWLPKLIFKNS